MFAKLKDCVITNKNVFVRSDMNAPMKNGNIIDDTRIKAVIPTIEYLIKNNAKVVLATHIGRPKGQIKEEFSTKVLLPFLNKYLPNVKIYFANDCIGDETRDIVKNAKYGEVVLLENLRFHKGEVENEEEFSRELASLANVYVNEAFACCHRAHASIDGISSILKSCMGFSLEKEIESLTKLFENIKKPNMSIIGGAKISTKLNLLNNLIETSNYLVIGGAMANTFLYAQGFEVGKSLFEKEQKENALEILRKAKRYDCNIILPKDVTITHEIKDNGYVNNKRIELINKEDIIVDMGLETIYSIKEKLIDCKYTLWNGPIGVYEVKPFDEGTKELAKLIALMTQEQNLISVAGGGDIVGALNSMSLLSKFTYISTAGGAFLKWLENRELIGLKNLKN